MEPTFSLPTTGAADTAALVWTWIAEALAESKDADTSFINGILSIVPDLLQRSSPEARERIALKYLEEWLQPGWTGPPLPCDFGGIDADQSSAECLLLNLLKKAETSGGVQKKETKRFRHGLRQLIRKKRKSLPKCFLEQLVDKGQVTSSTENSGFSMAEVANLNGLERHSHQISDDQNIKNGDKQNGDKRKPGFTDYQRRLLKKIAAARHSDADEAILHEYPSGSGQRSPQQNGDKIQLLKKVPAVPSADNGQETLQGDPHGYRQQSVLQIHQQNGEKHKSKEHISTALAVESGDKIFQHDNSGLGHQSTRLNFSEGDNRNFARRDDGITCDEIMLQEGHCGSGKQSPLQKAHCNHKELQSLKEIIAGDNYKQMLGADASGYRKPPPEVNSAPLLPCNGTNTNQDSHAFGSKIIVRPSNCRHAVAHDELTIPKAPVVVDGCHDLSSKTHLKEMVANGRNQNSVIPVVPQGSTEGDMIENGLCSCCDKGGLLLKCSGRNCSVAVHESCVEPPITIDQKGCFICPVCSYNEATRSYNEATRSYYRAKKRYSLAKKAFEKFVGKDSERQSQE